MKNGKDNPLKGAYSDLQDDGEELLFKRVTDNMGPEVKKPEEPPKAPTGEEKPDKNFELPKDFKLSLAPTKDGETVTPLKLDEIHSFEGHLYRSSPKQCRDCPHKALCGASEKGQKQLSTHIWQVYLDTVERVRKTECGKALYAPRKETIERVFGNGKENHALRYTHHRGLTRVTQWVRLKFAAMNLKKLANWAWDCPYFPSLVLFFLAYYKRAFVCSN